MLLTIAGHIPATIMDCDSPFLLEAPDNTWVVSDPEQKGNFGRESAWVMCNTVARLNQASVRMRVRMSAHECAHKHTCAPRSLPAAAEEMLDFLSFCACAYVILCAYIAYDFSVVRGAQ